MRTTKAWGNMYNFGEKPMQFKKALYTMDSILKKAKIDYCIYGGVLLGWIREGKPIPWDDDIDISIKDHDAQKLELVVEEMANLGFDINPYKNGPNKIMCLGDKLHNTKTGAIRRLRVIEKGKEIIIDSGYHNCFFRPFGIKIEINVFYKVGTNYYWVVENIKAATTTSWTLPAIHIDNLSSFLYDGVNYPIPSQPEKVLELCYGDTWKIPQKNDPMTHMYENKNGKILKGV